MCLSSHPTLERKTKISPVGNSELISNDVWKHNCRNNHLNSPVEGPESLWIAYIDLQYCRDKPITMHKTNLRRNLNSISQQTNKHLWRKRFTVAMTTTTSLRFYGWKESFMWCTVACCGQVSSICIFIYYKLDKIWDQRSGMNPVSYLSSLSHYCNDRFCYVWRAGPYLYQDPYWLACLCQTIQSRGRALMLSTAEQKRSKEGWKLFKYTGHPSSTPMEAFFLSEPCSDDVI